MNKFFSLVLIVAFGLTVGCGEEPVATSGNGGWVETLPSPPIVAPEPEPTPVTDDRFDTEEEIEAWRAEFRTALESYRTAPDPMAVIRLADAFKLKPEHLIVYADPMEWQEPAPSAVATEPVPTPAELRVEAERLEGEDSELNAGEIYAELGDTAAVKRCAKALVEEGEWKAVAMLSVLSGDVESLDRATDQLMGAFQVSRTKDVVRYAFLHGHNIEGERIMQRHGFEMGEHDFNFTFMARQRLEDANDARLMLKVFPEAIAWSYECGEWSKPAAADILLVAKTDKAGALGLAKLYIARPETNLFIEAYEGEGTHVSPFLSNIELFQLVRGDAALREAYFVKAEASFRFYAGLVPDRQESVICGGSYSGALAYEEAYVYSYLREVAKTRDQGLIDFWARMLSELETCSTGLDTEHDAAMACQQRAYVAAVGRSVLGKPMAPKAELLDWQSRYLLARAQGQAEPELDDDTAEDVDFQEFFETLSRGDLARTDLDRLWGEFELPWAEDDGVRYAPAEFSERAADAARLYESYDTQASGEAMMLRLIHSGYRGDLKLPDVEYGFRTGVSAELAYAAAGIGQDTWAKTHIGRELESRAYNAVINSKETAKHDLIEFFRRPYRAAHANAGVKSRHPDIDASPASDEEAYAIVAPVVAPLLESDRELYEILLGDSDLTALREAEIARLQKEGKYELVAELTRPSGE